MKPILLFFCFVCMANVVLCQPVFAGESSNATHTLLASTYTCCQQTSSGGVYVLRGTAGEQATAGKASGGDYTLYNSLIYNAIPEPVGIGCIGLCALLLLRKYV